MRNRKQLQQIAVRSVQASNFKLDDNNLNVSGYVNETGKKSDPIPNFGEVPDDGMNDDPEEFIEIMQPGVFKDAIKNADFVDFLFEHNTDDYLASTRVHTLHLKEDNIGLKMSANITPTSWGRDAYTLIKHGDVQSMSFGFIPLEDKWDFSGNIPVRTVTKIQLLEVSAVRFPAYPDSSIEARKKRLNRLNKMFEKRGYTLRTLHKRGVSKMPKEKIKKTEKRDGGSMKGMQMNSSDTQNIASALNNLANAIDNNTNALQENSEVQSNIATKIMQAANGDRSKKDVHKDVKKSEKRDGEAKPKVKKPAKEVKPAPKKPKVEPKPKAKEAPKEAPKAKSEDDKRAKKPVKEVKGKAKEAKRADKKYADMFKDLEKMDA